MESTQKDTDAPAINQNLQEILEYAQQDKLKRSNGAPTNPTEAALYRQLDAEGWTILRRGWPDFYCIRGDELMLVEVKAKKDNRLRAEQGEVLYGLGRRGIPCFKWSPNGGLERVTGEMRIEVTPPKRELTEEEKRLNRAAFLAKYRRSSTA